MLQASSMAYCGPYGVDIVEPFVGKILVLKSYNKKVDPAKIITARTVPTVQHMAT